MDSITPLNEIQNAITNHYNYYERFPVAVVVERAWWEDQPKCIERESLVVRTVPLQPTEMKIGYYECIYRFPKSKD